MAKGRKEIYKLFCKDNGKDAIDYNTFVEIISKFNKNVVDLILDGKYFTMKHNMSTLSIARNKRDPACPKIDWKATNDLKKEYIRDGVELYNHETGEGTRYLVYYTDEYYVRFRWVKDQCKVSNKFVYRFDAARGTKGTSPMERLASIINNDDLAYLTYKPLMNGNI